MAQHLNSEVASRRTRTKKSHNGPMTVQKLLTNVEPIKKKNSKFVSNIDQIPSKQILRTSKHTNNANNTLILNNKSPEKRSYSKEASNNLSLIQQSRISNTSKTAQSLPRRLQSNFISNINTKTNMQNIQSENTQNQEMYRNKTGVFLPYTGVEQAFCLNRPSHVRQADDKKEQLNTIGMSKYNN